MQVAGVEKNDREFAWGIGVGGAEGELVERSGHQQAKQI
jgi:hypothetical protein